jgi:hypothetical protein
MMYVLEYISMQPFFVSSERFYAKVDQATLVLGPNHSRCEGDGSGSTTKFQTCKMLRREASVIHLNAQDVLDFTVAKSRLEKSRKKQLSSMDNSFQDSFEMTQTRQVDKRKPLKRVAS